MPYLVHLIVLLPLLFVVPSFSQGGVPLRCYAGWQIWSEEESTNNVTLQDCQIHHNCCFFVASLPGNNFGCYDDCPADGVEACGPNPNLGIQDILYCYCKDHTDARCQPFRRIK